MAQPVASERGHPPPKDQMSAVKVAFPKTPEEFDADPRVSFSQQTQTYILEDDDGSEWEWNDAIKKWGASLDEDLINQQQQAYGGDDGQDPVVEPPSKKRKADDAQPSPPPKKTKPPATERKNSAVYVTSLPPDTTVDELAGVFKRYGIIAEATEGGAPRVKLYTDDDGNFKSEALVVYFKPESVQLAIQMLDETDFRLGEAGPNGKMRVVEADASFKKSRKEEDGEKRDGETAKGGPVKRRKKMTKEQKMAIKKTQKMNDRLADWSSDSDTPNSNLPAATAPGTNKVVILKHMFTPAELEEDQGALADIRDDTREEAEKLGTVANVTVFDLEPQGVISVRFRDAAAAQKCVDMMNGRHFDGRTVVAALADGEERFRKTKGAGKGDEEVQEEVLLEKFGDWLEKGDE